MGLKANEGYGFIIGIAVVAAAATTVYLVNAGYESYQQDQALQDQIEQRKAIPVSAIELPPPKNPGSSLSFQDEWTLTPYLTITTTLSPTPSISPTGSTTPLGSSTIPVNSPTNTPPSTLLHTPTMTPSQTLRVDTATPSQTQPSSTPTPIPPTATNTQVPTIDPKLCKVDPDETGHPHYCTPTP